MKIYSMTATFGKLQNQTLTLQPGLNIIEAPNEWGKSTWCSFLVTMLYGIDTKARTTKDALADKDHYKPWSGSPMSGSMDINWNGRDITIQRRSRGRTPMGEFYAYETDTGLEVKELTAENCGQLLLGVERSVFTRSGFLRFADLPVEQDEALRHRLNALVTTGDESNTALVLGQKLKDLKNKCRYNRSGLLPQAEAQRDMLQNKLNQQDELLLQTQRLQKRQQELELWLSDLKNHRSALAYAAAQKDQERVAQATEAAEQSRQAVAKLEAECSFLPSKAIAEHNIETLAALRREADELQLQQQNLPPAPTVPQAPPAFTGLTPEDAVVKAQADRDAMLTAAPRKASPYGFIAGVLGAGASIGACFLNVIVGIIGLLVLMAIAVSQSVMKAKQAAAKEAVRNELCACYGSNDPDQWVAAADSYASAWTEYRTRLAWHTEQRKELDAQQASLNAKLSTWGNDLAGQTEKNRKAVATWDALHNAQREKEYMEKHLATLVAMVKTVPAPEKPDTLDYSQTQTEQLLAEAMDEQRQLNQRLGQYQGQAESFGNRAQTEQELQQVCQRIVKLEQTYAALDYAQEALIQAAAQLQRRFAPRITRAAQKLFAQLTAGRYEKLTLGEDLAMQASAQGEDTLRGAQWRSDGTIDQLYLALRLAVAQELTPEAPLVLDDALVRFDDMRLKAALHILKEQANAKQVILFTCQDREKRLVSGCPCDTDECLL